MGFIFDANRVGVAGDCVVGQARLERHELFPASNEPLPPAAQLFLGPPLGRPTLRTIPKVFARLGKKARFRHELECWFAFECAFRSAAISHRA